MQSDIGAVEAAQKDAWRATVKQALDNLGPRFGVGRGGKGRQGHVQNPPQIADAQIIGAEIVAPLADAMRFVHGNQTAHARAPEHPFRARGPASRSGAI
jgi:hypothetical protein